MSGEWKILKLALHICITSICRTSTAWKILMWDCRNNWVTPSFWPLLYNKPIVRIRGFFEWWLWLSCPSIAAVNIAEHMHAPLTPIILYAAPIMLRYRSSIEDYRSWRGMYGCNKMSPFSFRHESDFEDLNDLETGFWELMSIILSFNT